MEYFDITVKDVYSALIKINSWESWELFEKRYFNEEYWKEKDLSMILKEENIKPVYANGIEWKHVITPYILPKKYECIYEFCFQYAVKKLDYITYINNVEENGRWCVFCKRYAKVNNILKCPFCNHYLLLFPLNEK